MSTTKASLFCSIFGATILLTCVPIIAQVPSANTVPPAVPIQVPLTTQIKKTVTFLSAQCLHDFKPEIDSLSKDQLLKMTDSVRLNTAANLIFLTARLQGVKQIVRKLDSSEVVRLRANTPLNRADLDSVIEEIQWRLQLLVKMNTLTAEEIATLTPAEVDLLPTFPQDEFLGTGFIVNVPLVEPAPGAIPDPKRLGLTYLITNRHVVQPGVQRGKPCKVVSSKLILNRKPDAQHPSDWAESSRIEHLFQWNFSDDESVDLAVAAIGIPENLYDVVGIPTEQFITEDDVRNKSVVEGDPVLFSGLFIQSFREVHTLEPIVRSGTLAMVPEGMLNTTLNDKPGHIYLAEVHAFGGNSGSPMFIDTSRFKGIISGPAYQFLGVVSGEMLENADLTLNVTTTVTGDVGANADVSTVVPAKELLSILNKNELKAQRKTALGNINSQAVPKPK